MRQLFPLQAEDVDPAPLYTDTRPMVGDRPYVVVNMVTSIDGATAVGGVTAKLGGPGDRRIFFLLRSLADVILVGAQTVRAEGYGPPRLAAQAVKARLERGQPALPTIAVVSRSLDFDWSSPLFSNPTTRPILLTVGSTDDEGMSRAGERAEVLIAGDTSVDLAQGLRQLRTLGAALVLCEGGPTLNAGLANAGVLDELCLTVAPLLVGDGGPARIMGDHPLDSTLEASMLHVLEEDGFLFLRYRLERGDR